MALVDGTCSAHWQSSSRAVSEWTDTLVRQHPDLTARHFVTIETGDAQVALVYLDGRLARVLPPAKRVLYFRGQLEVTCETIDVRAEPAVPARIVGALARLGRDACAVLAAIDEGKRALVYLDGRLIRELGAGTYGFWSAVSVPRIDVLEARRQTTNAYAHQGKAGCGRGKCLFLDFELVGQ